MTEETLIKANFIFEQLKTARKSLSDIDDLLSWDKPIRAKLKVLQVNEMSVDETRPTELIFKDEFDDIIELVKNIRLKKVEDLEAQLYDIED